MRHLTRTMDGGEGSGSACLCSFAGDFTGVVRPKNTFRSLMGAKMRRRGDAARGLFELGVEAVRNSERETDSGIPRHTLST